MSWSCDKGQPKTQAVAHYGRGPRAAKTSCIQHSTAHMSSCSWHTPPSLHVPAHPDNTMCRRHKYNAWMLVTVKHPKSHIRSDCHLQSCTQTTLQCMVTPSNYKLKHVLRPCGVRQDAVQHAYTAHIGNATLQTYRTSSHGWR